MALSQSTEDTLKEIIQGNPQEDFFDTLHDIFENRAKHGSKLDMIAQVFCGYATLRICEQLPGNPAAKDFGDETIGERAERIIKSHGGKWDHRIAEIVDAVISDAVVERRLKEWRDAKKS